MDIATLGIQITQQGADEAKAKLDALTASGAKAEAQFTSSSAKIQQSLATQTAAVREAYAAWQKGEASLDDERLLRHEGLIRQSTQDYYALAAAERTATEAQVQQIAAQGSGLYATQAMIKAQAEAIAMDAKMVEGYQLHGLQLGRLNQEIGTFIGRLTGTNTAVTRLTAQLGGAVVGYGSMIAVLGGVTLAIAGAEAIYNKFTEASRKAREENERLLKVLDDIAKRRWETQVTTTQGAIAAGQARLADLQAQLTGAEAAANSAGARGFAGGGAGLAGLQTPFSEAQAQKIQELKDKVASADAELTELVRKGAEERDRAITSDIANLVKSGQATEKQVTFAKQLLAGYEDSLTKLQKAGSSDTAALVDLADKIKQLNDALYPKHAGKSSLDSLAELESYSSGVTEAMLRQADAVRATAKAQDDYNRATAELDRLASTRLSAGNIDIMHRPHVRNADGSISTVRSMSFEEEGKEILVPTVSDQGTILSDQQAVDAYHQTGKNLGIFRDAAAATAYAKALHEQQAALLQVQDATAKAAAAQSALTFIQNGGIEKLQKQADEMRQVAAENHREDASARYAAAAVGLQGAQLDILNAKRKAELDRLQAYQQYSGPALTDRLNQIAATEQQSIATASVKQRFDDAKASEKLWSDAQKEANDVANKNTKAIKEQTDAGLALYQKMEAESKRLAASISGDLLGAFERLGRGGALSLQSLVEAFDRAGVRMVESLSQSLAKQEALLKDALAKGQSADAAVINAKIDGLESLRKKIADVVVAAEGFQIGRSLGEQAGSLGNGAALGAGTGAIQGALAAGPIGAVIGGIAGAVGGLVGAADAHKQAAQQLKDAAKQIEQGLANYASSNSVQSALNANQSQYLQLQTAIINALKAGVNANPSSPQGAFETYQDQTTRLEQERLDNIKRITTNFFNTIEDKLRSLSGPAGDYQNALLAVQREYEDNIASATALYKATGDLSVLTRGLADAEALRAAEEAKLKATEAERLKQQALSLDAREAEAKGYSTVAALITRRAAEEKELFDDEQAGFSATDLARVKYIQGLEDEKTALQKLNDAKATLAQNLAAGPNGTLASQQAADLQPLIDKQTADATDYAAAVAQLNADILNGADAATIAADKQAAMTAGVVAAGDAAAIAAKQWQDSVATMQQATSDIQNDVKLGFITVKQGLAEEAQNFGFAGLTPDQIRALYTPYDPNNPLTNQQRETNKNVAQYLSDLQAASGATTNPNNPNVRGDQGGTSAVANAARALTEYTGNRMADYLASINIHVASLDKGLVGGNGLTVSPSSSPSAVGLTSADIDKLLLGIENATAQPQRPTVEVNVAIAPSATESPDVYARRVASEIAKKVQEILAAQYSDSQIRAGSTLKIGA